LTAFERLFVPEAFREAVAERAWLDAMLDAERALANAGSLVGIVPAAAAAAIAEQCEPSRYDADTLWDEGRAAGNPVEPLVRALRERAGGEAASYVHFGATSQDVLDTAAMIVSRSTVALLGGGLDGLAAACAGLAREHRSSPISARTLLQKAVPTTFGAKVAGWLVGVLDARAQLAALHYPAQLGGAAGTLAALGPRGLDVLAAYAAELELEEPALPWHADRGPVAAIAAALGQVAAVSAKIGADVVLLAQTEVGEVSPREGGRSTAMPHKRNPVSAVLARACARIVHANVAVLTAGEHEHERAAGAWHAEWPALSTALAYAGGSAGAARACIEGLDVHPERMRTNLGEVDLDVGSAEAFVDRALARYESSHE
jgi:3-carboxy-cis,cis-muconate cycloisomerase